MSPSVIRPARPGDLAAAIELVGVLDRLQRPWRVFEPRPGADQDTVARYHRALDDPGMLLVVAEHESRLVGLGVGEIVVPSSMSRQMALEISNVVVAEAHRGRGLGRAVVAELVRFGGERGVPRAVIRVFSDNADAMAFWESLGFRPRAVQLTAPLETILA